MEETPVQRKNPSGRSTAEDPRVPFEDLISELRY